MMRASYWLLLAAPLILLSCSHPEVQSESAQNTQLGRYRKYAWAPPARWQTPADHHIANLENEVPTAAETELASAGFIESQHSPDFYISYQVTEGSDFAQFDSDYWMAGEEPPYVPGYSNPAIVGAAPQDQNSRIFFEFVDAKTGLTFWRGSSQEITSPIGLGKNQVTQAIDQILAQYPSPTLNVALKPS